MLAAAACTGRRGSEAIEAKEREVAAGGHTWDGAWVTTRRVRVYSRMLLATFVVLWCVYALSGSGLAGRGGEVIGADFHIVYAASTLASEGRATDAYDSTELLRTAHEQTGSNDFDRWSYPPQILLFIAPFAKLPYLLAFGTWALIGTVLYLATIRAIAPLQGMVVVALSFGGWFLSVSQGQNGCISAAILGAGLLLLDSRPYVAGGTLGVLTYKPQLALVVPVVLLATRRWRQLAAFSGSVLMLAGASAAVFGVDAWAAFWNHSSEAFQILGAGGFKLEKMPTLTSTLLMLNAPMGAAIAMQGIAAVGAVGATVFIWRRQPRSRVAAAALPAASLLCTPYAYDYDLAVLAVSGAFLVAEARERGWLGGEKAALSGAWALAPSFPLVAMLTGLQVGSLVVALPLCLALRRTLHMRQRA